MEQRRVVTKSELAYEIIREGILTLQYKPGERIVIREVAQKIGISDIPVREALYKLQSEGMVETEPHVGFRVTKISDKKTFENLELKYELEAAAARMAAKNMTDEQLAEAEKLFHEVMYTVEAKDHNAYFNKIREFNLFIYSHCHNERMYELLLSLFDVTKSLAAIYVMVPDWFEYSVKAHREIFDKIKAHEPEEAYTLLRNFKFDGLRMAIKSLSEYGIEDDLEKQWQEKGHNLSAIAIKEQKKKQQKKTK